MPKHNMALRRRYALYYQGDFRQNFTLELPLMMEISVGIGAALHLAESLPPAVQEAAVHGFSKFDVNADDPDQVCLDFATKFGIALDDFDIELIPHCTLDDWRVDETAENVLEGQYKAHPPAVEIPGATPEDSLYSLGYEFRRVGQERIAHSEPDYPEIPRSNIPDEEAVKREAEKNAKKQECMADHVEVLKLASTHGIPQSKTEWFWARTSIGRCKFHIWQCRTRWRTVEYILYCTLSYLDLDKRLKQIFEECLVQAAIEGAILGLALQSVTIAEQTFIVRFKTLIYERLHQEVKCLLPRLHVVTEYGPWK